MARGVVTQTVDCFGDQVQDGCLGEYISHIIAMSRWHNMLPTMCTKATVVIVILISL